MGSCISKCGSKKKSKQEFIDDDLRHVHDKLVISQAPISSSIRKPVSPSHSAASSTSFPSVSGGINCSSSAEFSTSSSSSSYSSTCSSSVLIAKDRAFSNEFLWSCAKENPEIIGRNVIKGTSLGKPGMSDKVHYRKFDFPSPENPSFVPIKQAVLDSQGGSTPKKRARANSPTLIRQKSFRKEPDKVSSPNSYHLRNRTLMRSPSPSRRFNGESLRDSSTNATKEIHCRRSSVPKSNAHNSLSCSSMRKHNFRAPQSPSYDLSRNSSILKNTDAFIPRKFGSRKGEVGVGEKEANLELEAMIVEDIHNPLIALDCFIFL